jgi:cytoskeleton protein RodZ
MSEQTPPKQEPDYSEMTHDTAKRKRHSGPGAILKQRREERHLDINDVALQLHLSSTAIEALENNHFQYFPGIVFVRGHLRSYARLLNLSADEVIANFNELGLDEGIPKMVPTKVYVKPAYLNEKVLRIASYTGGILVILGIALWWSHHASNQQELVSPNGGSSTTTTTSLQQNNDAAATKAMTEAEQQAARQQLQQILPNQGAISTVPAATTGPSVPAPTPAAAGVAPAIPAPASNVNHTNNVVSSTPLPKETASAAIPGQPLNKSVTN